MEQVGRVIGIDGEMVRLEVKRMSACGTSCDSCHASCEQKSEYITLPNLVQAKMGDYVEIYSDTSFILKSMAKVYGIPLVFFISFIVISTYAGFSQFQALSMGVGSLVLSFLILRLLDKKNNASDSLKITRIL